MSPTGRTRVILAGHQRRRRADGRAVPPRRRRAGLAKPPSGGDADDAPIAVHGWPGHRSVAGHSTRRRRAACADGAIEACRPRPSARPTAPRCIDCARAGRRARASSTCTCTCASRGGRTWRRSPPARMAAVGGRLHRRLRHAQHRSGHRQPGGGRLRRCAQAMTAGLARVYPDRRHLGRAEGRAARRVRRDGRRRRGGGQR